MGLAAVPLRAEPPENVLAVARRLLAAVETGRVIGLAFVTADLAGEVTECWAVGKGASVLTMLGGLEALKMRFGAAALEGWPGADADG